MSTRHYGASDEGGFYFQSESAATKSARRAEKAKGNSGQPLRLNAKLSVVLRDESDIGVVFVADNGGGVRKVDLKTNKIVQTYRGPRYPITSLTTDPSHTILFAGSWDKSIWSWDISTGAPQHRYIGHSDFVNCVNSCHVAFPTPSPNANESPQSEKANGTLLLLSGSVDATIIVWRVSTGERLHTLKGHTRGVLDLAVDPLSELLITSPALSSATQQEQKSAHPSAVYVLSASSTPEIRCWRITHESATESTATLGMVPESDVAVTARTPAAGGIDEGETHVADTESQVEVNQEEAMQSPNSAPMILHDTNVNKILFSPSSDSAGPAEWELFTASSDNTAKSLSRPAAKSYSGTNQAGQPRSKPGWTVNDTFTHPDWVRAIAHDPATGLLVTGCRDEEVRVWNTSSGELVRTFSGHFDGVEGVCLVEGLVRDGNGASETREGMWIISVSLDGTLRRWRLDGEGANGGRGNRDRHIGAEDGSENEVRVGNGTSGGGKSLTTEDEDRELAELMAELEDDD